ncbi:MAG: 50S ribosomal protein L19e [Candidatus Bathyarchaeia archaeon]
MTNLSSQRRLAAQILKVGQNRVWIDPARISDVESAITRDDIRRLVREKIIVPLPVKGVSRSRAKIIRRKKQKGRRRGPGSRVGSRYAKIPRKEAWIVKIRSLRKRLRELKVNRVITETTYTQMYRMVGSGRFASVADLERYLKQHDLWRTR